MKTAMIVLFTLSMASAAQAGCPAGSYTSVAAARNAENRCMADSNLPSKQGCLDEVADWWFECGGEYVTYNPYTEMTRIFKIQLQMSPTRVETISNLAYYTFSIEDDAILSGTLPDFTAATANAFSDLESYNFGDFQFREMALATPALIIARGSPAKPASRIAYYANLKQNYAKACALVKAQLNPASGCAQWITSAPYSGPCLGTVPQSELSVCVASKTLVRYKQYDSGGTL